MSRNNSFDLLRLIFSVFVIISHCTYISGIHNPFDIDLISKRQTYLGEIGVMGFFSLSGFLITASFLRTKSVLKFVFNRAVRIFPGFWVCIFLTAFIIAPLIYFVENHSLNSFRLLGNYSSYTYVRQNFFTYIRQAEIAHVLDRSTVHNLNGSLWTLFYEILCYITTLAFGLCGLLSKYKKAFFALFCSLYIYYIFTRLTSVAPEHYKLFISYLCGSVYYLFYKPLSVKTVSILSAFFIVLLFTGFLHIFMPILIALISINLFSSFALKMPLDISYGLYIYSFPVQQLLNSMNLKTPILFLLSSLLITSILAILSFIIIERPFMRLKKLF